ncbi:glycosyltransferase family 2 protein [Vibrio vulnificus]|nr:capsular biosynthesis protein [Vibrio vulnificus]EIZ1171831.1 glycosyltransferase family 2 protein [Vibrio vulnificus]EKG2460211.1 glycosyltransferase family 2 protein [Vibrio vulnificus]
MIVIPMAGKSSRFFNAGYTKPKYMLEARGKTLFEHSVNSFENYFDSECFIFIIRDEHNTLNFVNEKIKKLGIKNHIVFSLPNDTSGQAETVAIGLESLDSTFKNVTPGLTIFNIDTIRPNFIFPSVKKVSDGYLEVFEGEGDNWSFVKAENENSTQVIKTAEKRAISNLCSTGLYYFRNKDDYLSAFYNYKAKPKENWDKGELYIAPLYNYLIERGCDVQYEKICRSDVIFCGVPEEYVSFSK